MNPGGAIVELLLVLVAAKAAAELSERVRIPSVLGEIVAGMLIGPSVLGLIHRSEATTEFLQIVGEIGVILLLLQVGLEFDLRELRRVGAASTSVALVGIAAPFAGGWGAMHLLGYGGITAVFVGAALTATSVGLTARAFSDMRMMSSIEARIVVGAAVADDVLGLVILTVVARLAEEGSVNPLGALGVMLGALGFLVAATAVGQAVAPRLFDAVARHAVGGGTFVAAALAFTLALSQAAHAAGLAAIVGAFVGGMAMGRSRHAERIDRELSPLAHVLVPVFFLEIGAQADLSAMARPSVLVLAGALTVVAVLGKVLAGWAAVRTRADRLLVGLGLIPRGEVGLIFATLGLRVGVLDAELYAALLLVVLVSTVVTPPLLRMRGAGVVRRRRAERDAQRADGDSQLLVVGGEVHLRGTPSADDATLVALRAARLAAELPPSAGLADWLGGTRPAQWTWDPSATPELLRLLQEGSARSWRFLAASGLLEHALPELGEALRRRSTDLTELEISQLHRWPALDRLRGLAADDVPARRWIQHAGDESLVFLAALCADIGTDAAPRFLARLGLDSDRQEHVLGVSADGPVFRAVAARAVAPDDREVTELAVHLGNERRSLHAAVLALALGELDPGRRARLDDVVARVRCVLQSGGPAGELHDLVAARRRAAMDLTEDVFVAQRLLGATPAVLLSSAPEDLARRVALLGAAAPPRGYGRVCVERRADARFSIDVACRDQPWLLAHLAGVLSDTGLSIVDATAATWPDGAVLDSFVVDGPAHPPSAAELEAAIAASLRRPLDGRAVDASHVDVDNESSPWHTLVSVEADDRPGLLHDVCCALARHRVEVVQARVTTEDGVARDRFAVLDRRGRKLSARTVGAIVETMRARSWNMPFTRRRSPRNTASVRSPRHNGVRGPGNTDSGGTLRRITLWVAGVLTVGTVGAAVLGGTAGAQTQPGVAEQMGQTLDSVITGVNLLWIVIGAVLVIFMQAGFALVETGFCRAKHAAHVVATNFAIFGLGFVAFFIVGYGFMFGGYSATFGPDAIPVIGNAMSKATGGWLIGDGANGTGILAWTTPGLGGANYDAGVMAFFLYMVAFMDTTATIPTGSMAERWKWKSFVVWGIFCGAIYYPLFGAMTWGGGWLSQLGNKFGIGLGYTDFAGSGVVHAVGGVAALAGAIVLGPRLGKFGPDGKPRTIAGHHIPMAMLGTFVLLFGWFGFNAASTLAATDVRFAVIATNTAIAGAFGAVVAMLWSMRRTGKPDPGMMANGMLGGLVAITAPSAFVQPWAAAVIGSLGAVLVYESVGFIERRGIDDPVGAISVHGVGGIFGVLSVGIFADGTYGAGWNGTVDDAGRLVTTGPTGVLYGEWGQLGAQVVGALVICTLMFGLAFAFFKIQNAVTKGGIRSEPEHELGGLDEHEMGVFAYPEFQPAEVDLGTNWARAQHEAVTEELEVARR